MMDQEQEILARIKVLETKVDKLVAQMERAMGAWLFVKILGSMAIGATVVWGFLADVVARLKP